MLAIGVLLIVFAVLCLLSIVGAGVIEASGGDGPACGFLLFVVLLSAVAFLVTGILVLCLLG